MICLFVSFTTIEQPFLPGTGQEFSNGKEMMENITNRNLNAAPKLFLVVVLLLVPRRETLSCLSWHFT